MSRFVAVLCGLWLVNLVGCQCCCLTEHYAGLVDCISDHEHHYEVLYSPCYDLNRIGRSDWCWYPVNRLLCRCACERCRPAPCGYCVSVETGRTIPHPVSYPDWSEEMPPPVEPAESEPEEQALDIPDPSELSIPPVPADEAEETPDD